LRAALDAALDIEVELEQTRQHVAKLNEQHAQDLEDHATMIIERMTSVFGSRNLLKTLNKTEEVNPIGVYIKQRREALGISQLALAEKAGVSKSTISRAESSGQAEDIGSILAALVDAPINQQTDNAS
jgi:DNA-binding XRE family transcriptional regulator